MQENNLMGSQKGTPMQRWHSFKVTCIFLTILLLFSLIIQVSSASSETLITNSQGGLYFTGSSSDPLTMYQDAVGGNLDVGIRLCGFGQRYVGGFYAINVSGSYIYSLITYQNSANALSYTDASIGGGCYDVTGGFLTVSPSQLTTPNPDVNKAAFPARLWTGYDVVSNPGAMTTFAIGGNDSYLRGNYSVQSAFNYTTRKVTIQSPDIIFETTSANFTKNANDSQFGLASDRQMVVGLCSDSNGATCSDGGLYTNASSFPLSYSSDLIASQINDQQTHIRYIVINGLGVPFCVGSNLQIAVTNITPIPAYYSQNLTIQTTVTNRLDTTTQTQGGNVPIITPFSVNLLIYNATNNAQIYSNQSTTINPSLVPSASSTVSFTYPAYVHSGNYTAYVTVDNLGAIAECNESDNTANSTFYVNPIVTPTIRIDGVQTNTFATPNIPYFMNISMKNSDNDTLPNATVQIVEVNGLNINSGTQLYNITSGASASITKSGVVSKSISQVVTNHEGNVTFNYIPTYNQLYSSTYGYLQTTQYIGSDSRYITGTLANGTTFAFIVNGTLTTQYPLYIASFTFNVSTIQKSVSNNITMAQSFDNMYRVFSNFIRILVG